jgi:hypothetical protein
MSTGTGQQFAPEFTATTKKTKGSPGKLQVQQDDRSANCIYAVNENPNDYYKKNIRQCPNELENAIITILQHNGKKKRPKTKSIPWRKAQTL